MDKLLVHGGSTLKGSVHISGSKNASLPILAATLLTKQTCIIRRVPDVSDKASVSLPGGCVIGDRPVDLHLKGLEGIGADINMEGGNMIMQAPDGLHGKEVDLRGKHGPTVLGTDNLMMAAVLAKGTTVIESAACEPEVVDLANFLNKMGAKITGAGTRRITIEGVVELDGVEHTVIPDRIEAGTFMVAAAMAGCPENGVTLHRVCEQDLKPSSDKLIESGHHVEFNDAGTSCTVKPGAEPIGANIVTAPFPGFPTDMQAQFTSLFAITPGISVVEDTIFPQRFMHCAEMTRMGADIKVDNGTAIIQGSQNMSGAPVMASDLRASAALVLSGLCSKGTTEINRLYHIDRGYENIDDKLIMLGANIERVRE